MNNCETEKTNINAEQEKPIGQEITPADFQPIDPQPAEQETTPAIEPTPPKKTKKRIPELDILRFVAIVLMFIVHYNYLLAFVFYDLWPYDGRLQTWVDAADNYFATAYRPMQMTCGIMFTILSGITTSWTCGKKGLVKGAKYFAIAWGMTFALWIFYLISSLNIIIIFGVLHMLSSSMLIYAALKLLFFYNAPKKNAIPERSDPDIDLSGVSPAEGAAGERSSV